MSTVEATTNRTAQDWLDLLGQRLDAQQSWIAEYESYYAGEHQLAFATAKFREAFGMLFSTFADNWCEIVVDAPVERLEVVGFRFGDETEADNDAWSIWQANSLDVESVVAHTEAGKCGSCYLLVDPNDGEPKVTVEHAAQMVVATDPGNRRHRLAALKRWADEENRWFATLYLPDAVFRFQTEEPVTPGTEIEWTARSDGGSFPHGFAVVPVIPLLNKPGLLAGGQSDLKPAIPLQNAINKLCSDMVVASEYQAYRQRWVTGIEIPRDPETGRPLRKDGLEAAESRYWAFEDENVKVGDLATVDLSNFVRSIELFVQHLAAQTRTPPHYLMGQVVNASGDALKAAEAGLVSKCRAKQLYFSDSWEEAIALALQAAGGRDDAATAECEVLWADPEKYTPSQLADAATKKSALNVPDEVLWLELGYSPAEVERMKKINEEKAAEEPPPVPPVIPAESPPPETEGVF